ncbi:hypothetical protein HQ524_04515 [Candidatus Uhrbacteria bacterium]|nr:hypothetical protein [Candidatus Uhrbacteria bacterium]
MAADENEHPKKEVDQRLAQIEEQLSKIRKIITPEVTATSIINQTVAASSGSTLFFQDGNAGVFENNSVESTKPSGDVSPIKIATPYNNDSVGIDQENDFVFFYLANNSLSRIGINSAEGEAEQTRDIIHYGERMYVLSGNQIYRHQRVEGGEYGPGVAWVQDDTDITLATSIAIDGTVWIAGNNSLRHFDGGQEIGAVTASIDPPLGLVKDIWTDTDVPIILMLDTEQSRVVIYNKETGDMVGQVLNSAFGTAFAIYADSQSKVVTVISPSTVYTFSISEVL